MKLLRTIAAGHLAKRLSRRALDGTVSTLGLFRALVALGIILMASDAFAQVKAAQQDPALDNLRHAPGYRTAPLGTLQQVVRKGTGPVDVVLIRQKHSSSSGAIL